jgi:hypothetical protein
VSTLPFSLREKVAVVGPLDEEDPPLRAIARSTAAAVAVRLDGKGWIISASSALSASPRILESHTHAKPSNIRKEAKPPHAAGRYLIRN